MAFVMTVTCKLGPAATNLSVMIKGSALAPLARTTKKK
jgi:hypothetical protein